MKNETNAGLNTGTIIALILLGAAAVFGLLYIFVFSDRDDPAGIKSVRFRRIRNKLRAFLSGGDVTPVTQVTGIAKDLCEELKKCGCADLLKSDFQLPPLYLVPDLQDPAVLTSLLRGILLELEKHLGLPDNLGFTLLSPYEHQEKTTSGAYKSSRLTKGITVYQKEWHTWPNLVAIMCHEITHHFAAAHNLAVEDKDLNELRTDVLANLIGFSSYMANGYSEIEYPANSKKVYRVGYITAMQCLEAQNCLKKVRSKL